MGLSYPVHAGAGHGGIFRQQGKRIHESCAGVKRVIPCRCRTFWGPRTAAPGPQGATGPAGAPGSPVPGDPPAPRARWVRQELPLPFLVPSVPLARAAGADSTVPGPTGPAVRRSGRCCLYRSRSRRPRWSRRPGRRCLHGSWSHRPRRSYAVRRALTLLFLVPSAPLVPPVRQALTPRSPVPPAPLVPRPSRRCLHGSRSRWSRRSHRPGRR